MMKTILRLLESFKGVNLLNEITVKNIGPIKNGQIQPSRGLTAITGETGAGKSMLLSAIALISGGPVPRRAVPEDGEAVAQGVFELNNDSESLPLAKDQGLINDDEGNDCELSVTRIVKPSGRSRIKANGMSATRGTLAAITKSLLTVHGQNDQIRIMDPAVQLTLLDEYANNEKELLCYRKAYKERTKVEAQLKRLNSPEVRRRSEQLKQDIRKIEKADIKPGEYAELDDILNNIEELREKATAYSSASAILTDENGPLNALQTAFDKVKNWLDEDTSERFTEALSTLEDISDTLSDEDDEAPEFDINTAENRMVVINRMMRLYGDTEQAVLDYLEDAKEELSEIDLSEEHLEELKDDLNDLVKMEDEAAGRLTEARRNAAKDLQVAINSELAGLAMGGSSIIISVEPGKASPSGHDSAGFMFKTHEGAKPKPLSASASGGELSRIALVIELSLAARHPSTDMTFVFDEIDAGVGAATGFELGKRIARLAKSSQVIIVTHLAQVASWADRQFEVIKNDGSTTVKMLDNDGRVDAISRMFDGDSSEIGKEHARELLEKSSL